ncbi:MAG: flagellar hook-length control protein FliK [Leptospiraceae bacterium]|nr:flagellar hook-length control protein FliK [Leptospiraceae bacterium]
MSLVNEIGRIDFSRREEVNTSPQFKKEQSGNGSFLDILKNIQNSGQMLINEAGSRKQENIPTEKNNNESPKTIDDVLGKNESKVAEPDTKDEELAQELEKKEKVKSSHQAYFLFEAKIEKAAAKLKEALSLEDEERCDESISSVKLAEPELKTESKFDFKELVENLLFKKSFQEKAENDIIQDSSSVSEDTDDEDDFLIDDPRFLDSEIVQKIVNYSDAALSESPFEKGMAEDEFSALSNQNNARDGKILLKQDSTVSGNNQELQEFTEKSEAVAEKIKDSLDRNDSFDKLSSSSKEKDIDVSFLDKTKWQIRKEKEIENVQQDRFKKDELVEAGRINSPKDSSASGDRERGAFDDRRSGQFFLNHPVAAKEKQILQQSNSENLLKSEKFQKSLNDLVRQAKLNIVENGKSSAQISLHPKELGKVLLNVTIDKDKVEGKILVESETVKSAVAAEMASLKLELKSVGLDLENIQVEVGGNGGFLDSAKDGWANEEREERISANGKKNRSEFEENNDAIDGVSLNMLDIKV